MCIRLPVGLDLSDESYYAIFLDDWLKGGIRTSTLLTLHQTAALLIYPFAWLYVAVVGSSDGLLLFLRALFLLGSVITAAIWVRLLLRLGAGLCGWILGIGLIAFIPFGLPAPSYNTVGQQGLGIAVAAWGLASLSRSPSERLAMAFLSINAAIIACIAYPPLVMPIALMATMGIAWPTSKRPWSYLLLLTAGTGLAWCLVLWTLTPQKIWDSVIYLAAINEPTGLRKKLTFAVELLGRHPGFAGIALGAMAVGIARVWLGASATTFALTALMLATLIHPTVLFAKAHDAVTVAMLAGLGQSSGLRRNATIRERVTAVIYVTSLVAAAVTSASGTFPLYTLCIGGLPAAIIALHVEAHGRNVTAECARSLPALALLPSFLSTSLFSPYGEIPSDEHRLRITEGFFRGLLVKPRDSAPLLLIRDQVEPLFADDPTIAAFGRLPGLILASKARIKAPTSFPLMSDVPPQGLSATRLFFERPENRPAIVLVYQDPYFVPTNPIGLQFDRWYQIEKSLPTPLGELKVYKRR